jgi:murein DD-endopeptidase MepM/ murein hydrolase activator NlpD
VRFFLILWTLFALPFAAEAVELNGTLAQGGLVVGHAQPGSVITLDGQSVAVAANGVFVMGFARDAEETARLKVLGPGGAVEEQTLSIAKQTYQVQRIDGLPTRKVTPNPADVAHIKADNAKIGAVRSFMSTDPRFLSGFRWPVSGPISGVFGSQRILNGKPKSPHNGVDIAAPRGSTIQTPADGVVALVADDMFYTGKTMMIDHGLGLTSVYAHMDDIFVIEGQVLSQGDALGTVGQTGRATGPHLHWGLTWKSVHVDPQLAAGPMAK